MTDSTPSGADTRSSEEIEADLAQTREELGETIEELTAKLDVKERSRLWAQHKKTRTQQLARELRSEHSRELIVGGVAAASVVALVVWRVRHR